MKVFVAGATGVIGTDLIPLLIAAGHEVIGVSRNQQARQHLEATGAHPIEADLFDPAGLRTVLAGSEVVINLATSIPPLSRMGDRHAWDLNDRLRTEGAANLAGAAREVGAAIFIQPSVTFMYADAGDQWIDETFPLDPVSVLESAMDAEAATEQFADRGGNGVVLRLARLYGPGQASAELVSMLRERGGIVVGDGANYVSNLHVADAATAHLAAFNVEAGIYNVADDRPATSLELTTAQTKAVSGPPPQVIPMSLARTQLGETADMLTVSQRISNLRFKKESGWAPEYPDAVEGWESLP